MRSLIGLAVATALAAPFQTGALAADKVTVGIISNSSDAPFFIADAKGFFREQGIEVDMKPFDSAGRMVPSLGTGELDVGGGAGSAGLYNAVSRGVGIRIVGDRSRDAPGYKYVSLTVRKALVDSGKFKSYADLAGKRIALVAPGTTTASALNEAARKGGVSFADIDKIYLGFPQQPAAFANGAIDGSILTEPYTTGVTDAGDGVRFAVSEDFYPNYQIAVLFYGGKFISERRDVAQRFMNAYLEAIRFYVDGVEGGKLGHNANGNEIAAIVAKYLHYPDAEVRKAYVQAISPDGKPNLDTMRNDLKFFKEQQLVQDSGVTVDSIVDFSFVEAAARKLGPYHAANASSSSAGTAAGDTGRTASPPPHSAGK